MVRIPKDKKCWFGGCSRLAVKNIRFNKKTVKACDQCSQRADGTYFKNGQPLREK